MTERAKPASRRTNNRYEYILCDPLTGHRNKFYVDVGRYASGEVCEFFITAAKVGTHLRTLYEAFAIMASLAMQHGTPAAKVADSMAGIQMGTYTVNGTDTTVSSPLGLLKLAIEDHC